MRIEQGELLLRNAEAEDAALLARWWNDGAVMAHAGFPNGLGTTAEAVAASLMTDDDHAFRRLIAEYRGRAIGEMCVRHSEDGSASIGIKICDTSMQERGLGKRLLRMLIGTLFASGVKKIVLDTNLENRRAQHVYETLGFRKTAVHEKHFRDQLGEWQSTVDYELTPEQWHME